MEQSQIHEQQQEKNVVENGHMVSNEESPNTDIEIIVNHKEANVKPNENIDQNGSMNVVNNGDDDKQIQQQQFIRTLLDAEDKLYNICNDLDLGQPYFDIIERIKLNDRKYYRACCKIIDQCNRELEFNGMAISKRMARLYAAMNAVEYLKTNINHIDDDDGDDSNDDDDGDEDKKIGMDDQQSVDNDEKHSSENKVGTDSNNDDEDDDDDDDMINNEEPPAYEDSQTPKSPKSPTSPKTFTPSDPFPVTVASTSN
ncbi:uncharacterized protein LOC124497825 [Dermatophagoides farinae]|uniref:uncharacterized protein LOC124497825 n=1 Tax=Dermatophagoides farinae TaxID=6954 RepID=UPI001F0DD5F6|nr:protein PFC0760c-like [Dermatophagoides farinae]